MRTGWLLVTAAVLGAGGCKVVNPAYCAECVTHGENEARPVPGDDTAIDAITGGHAGKDAGKDAARDAALGPADAPGAADASSVAPDAPTCPLWPVRGAQGRLLLEAAPGVPPGTGVWTSLTFDHQALVAAGRSRADGADVQIAPAGPGPLARRFLDAGSAWNSRTTTLWFRLPGGTGEGAAAAAHLYLGDLAAAAVPEQPAPIVKGVQTASASVDPEDLTVLPIASVDPSRSWLIYQSRSASPDIANQIARVRLTSPTTLEVAPRGVDGAAPIQLHYSIVEFSNGVRVRQGSGTQASGETPIPLAPPVRSTAQALVVWSKTAGSNREPEIWSSDNPILFDLPAPDRLALRVGLGSTSHLAAWQLVEFESAEDVRVQRRSASLPPAATTATGSTGEPVDPARSFLLAGFTITGTNGPANLGQRLVSARLVDGATVEVRRGLASPDGAAINEVAWQTVELREGSTVRSGTATLAAGESMKRVPFDDPRPVAVERAVALATVLAGGSGANLGSTTSPGQDLRVCAVTTLLETTGLRLVRGAAGADCTIAWQVIEWAATARASTAGALEPPPGCSARD